MLRKCLTRSQSRHQITLPPALVWSLHASAPRTALSSVLPPCSHIWSIWPWHVLPEPLGLLSGSSCKHPLTHQPFSERHRGAALSTVPSLSLLQITFTCIFFPLQQKEGNLPTGQVANCPVLLHFLLTFFINLSTVRLI